MNNEKKALIWGVGINAFSAVLGFVFYGLTKSQSLLLDSLVSFILVLSTVISLFVTNNAHKDESEEFPLGRWAIENLFLVFRAILMLLIIVYTITEAAITMTHFFQGTLVDDVNISIVSMVTYAALMVGSCIFINIIYSYYNKKSDKPSPIITIEIKASIYDGLVTLGATTGLLLFYHVPFFAPVKEIGDAIVVTILSLIYTVTPVKEIIHQMRILSDKRQYQTKEAKIKEVITSHYDSYMIEDIYYSFSGQCYTIYVTLFPKENKTRDEIAADFSGISALLKSKEENTKVFLLLSRDKIHNL